MRGMQKPMEMLPGTKGEGGGEHLVGGGASKNDSEQGSKVRES